MPKLTGHGAPKIWNGIKWGQVSPVQWPESATGSILLLVRPALFLFLVAVLSMSCSEADTLPAPGREAIEPGLFARVFGDLVIARIEAFPDTAAYQRNRRSILERYGVTPEDMRTFVEVHGESDDLMARIYGVVDARLDTLFGERPGRSEPLTSPALDLREAIAEEEKVFPDR